MTSVHVQEAEPALKGDAVVAALTTYLAETEREYRGLGLKWNEEAKSEARYRFAASEAYLGKLSAPVFAGWCARNLWIQTKAGTVVPFHLNPMQYRFLVAVFELVDQGLPVRMVILKARQFGFSTLIQAILYYNSSVHRNFNATIIAHKAEATSNLYAMSLRYHRHLPHRARTKRSGMKGIIFDDPHDSTIRLDTAENKEAGRSSTNRGVHASELAFWPWAKTTRLGLVQTVADVPGTFIFEESTANGVGGTFHDQYWRAKSNTAGFYRAMFFPWFENPEYVQPCKPSLKESLFDHLDREEQEGRERWGWTAEQILWRRATIEDKCEGDVTKFHQEYPSTDRQAFLVSGSAVFDADQVARRFEEIQEPVFVGRLVRTET